jgi:glycosyltransferase involved in cell wall biosynthesis
MESISVVIPCYNQGRFLGDAIESVLTQTYPPREIVVVDDGSLDQSLAVVERYPSVRYIQQTHQGVVAAARNRGIEETTGTYLVFLDGDDRLLPHHLEMSRRGFQEQPKARGGVRALSCIRRRRMDDCPHVRSR